MQSLPKGVPRQSSVAEAFSALRSAFVGVGMISLVINLLMLTGPMFMLQIYDRVLASHSVPTLVVISCFAATLYVFFAVLEGIRARSLSRLSQKLDAQLTGASFSTSIGLPLALGAKSKGLDPVRDLEQMRQFWAGPGPAAIFDLPWMPIYLGIVFILHVWLGILAVAGAIIIMVLVLVNELMARGPTRELSQHSGKRSTYSAAARRNAEVIKAMGMTGDLRDRWLGSSDEFYQAQSKSTDRASFFSTVIKAFRFMLQSAVLGLGAWLAIHQEITPGVMIAASIITARALAPVETAVTHWRSFVGARQSKKRLSEVLVAGQDDKPDTALPVPEKLLTVEMVASAAPGERVLTVQGCTFRLCAGEGLGIIGPSGSGKTSLIRAIVGVWPIMRGSVRLDGAELTQWEEKRIGSAIGYLPQDVELFDGTVSENIARFDPERTAETVIAAARLANVHDMITGLPDGYDTPIGEGGARLSAGQRQRIGLARALYGEPFLIVLDEPNSNLDAEGEMALTVAIRTMREKGSITIIVAHRPSAIAAVDQLLFIRDGKQVAFGPKDEVLKQVTQPGGKQLPRGQAGS